MIPTFIRYNADKYQRVGLLKVLVAILDPQRRSVNSQQINRKFLQLLSDGRSNEMIKAQELICKADAPSWNFRFTRATVGQILEWGKLIGFVGSGNQITESGLLLRRLIGEKAISSIIRGDFEFNPFELTVEEKLYFLYRELEIDTPLFFLIKRLANVLAMPIGGMQGNRLACFALFDTYKLISEARGFPSANLLSLKNLRDLLGKIVTELNLSAEIPIHFVFKPRLTSALRAKPEQRQKKRTNASDGEGVPRLEFLTDIGFLVKRPEGGQEEEIEIARKAWRYWATPFLLNFSRKLPEKFGGVFCWTKFAEAAATLSTGVVKRLEIENNSFEIARRAYSAYIEVKRLFGHTPIESVAVLAMIRSLVDSEILEVKDVHELFLNFKRDNLFPEAVRFAAGNELDKMFIDINPSFIDEAGKYYGSKQ
jgi:hypothetical protein